jgi:hypothetical protein
VTAHRVQFKVEATDRPTAGYDWWVRVTLPDEQYIEAKGMKLTYGGACRQVRRIARRYIPRGHAARKTLP